MSKLFITFLMVAVAGLSLTAAETEAQRFVRAMGVGVNVGNTLDTPHGDEREWGNQPVTKELLDLYKSKGIKTLRLPVTWCEHFDHEAKGHPIEPAFLKKVDATVRLCLKEGFVVILNTHHDSGEMPKSWLILTGENDGKMLETLRDIWTQLAVNFKDCGTNLVFEGFNEVKKSREWEGPNGDLAGKDDWGGGPGYATKMNRLAEVFVQSVRRAGGRNEDRYLIVPTYAGCPGTGAMEAWSAPRNDPRVIAEVHIYSPGIFALWGDATVLTDAMIEEIERDWRKVGEYFAARGVAVIAGEVGAKVQYHDKDMTRPNVEDRVRWAEVTGRVAAEAGVVPFLWETGGGEKWGYPFFDRHNFKIRNEKMLDAFLTAYNTKGSR